MNIKHILRKDGENDIKLRSRIKKEYQIADLSKTIEHLQAQLAEANEVIKKYATGTTQIKAKTYEGSCYITDPFTGEQKIIEDWGEEYDADVPMSNDDKPAKKYLKKWGVK